MDRDGKGSLMVHVVWEVDSVVLFLYVEDFMVLVSDSHACARVLLPP